MLRPFGHIARMQESRITKDVYKDSVKGTIARRGSGRKYLD